MEEVRRFNAYILQSVVMLARERAGQGYGPYAFTQHLEFGNQGVLRASEHRPLTMCVAAQLEVFVEALNIYAIETNDYAPFTFLPKRTWERLGPTDLRGQIWMVENANASGAADALRNFGMGEKTTFEEMEPGDFMNFNRTSGTGHGVIFLAYLDNQGNEVLTYSPGVTGFKYFSSQQTETHGLGFRYALFDGNCMQLSGGRQPDCRVIRSPSQRLLNTGYALMPSLWMHVAAEPRAGFGEPPEGMFDAAYFDGHSADHE